MMNTELLYQEALALGLDKKYEFKSRLADLYVREIAEAARNKITDADLRQYFEENKEGIEQVSARHILLSTKETKSPKEKAELKEKLEGYRKELLKEPQHFAEYARKYSQDSSRNSGGELGFFTRAMMVPPFSKAAFKLKNVNDISDVVETQYGFHLIQLVGDRRGLEPSKDLIREQLLRKTQRERLDQALETLKKGKAFQVFKNKLSKLSPLPKEILTDPKDLIPPGSVGHESEPK
jgi:parvulin-like peptidyl-prolyl isomerase